MELRTLGRTNLPVPDVGFGGFPIQFLEKEPAVKVVLYYYAEAYKSIGSGVRPRNEN